MLEDHKNKVKILWEGYKFEKNLPFRFDVYSVVLSNLRGNFSNFCGFLKLS